MWLGASYSLSRHCRFISGQKSALTCCMPALQGDGSAGFAGASATGSGAATTSIRAAADAGGTAVGASTTRGGAGSVEHASAAPTRKPKGQRSLRVENKVRQHTLQTSWANALHAQQIRRVLEALQLRAQRHDGLRALHANTGQLSQLIGRGHVEHDFAIRRDPSGGPGIRSRLGYRNL